MTIAWMIRSGSVGRRTRCDPWPVVIGAHQPVAYDLRDELSVTISANPFDYDFNPIALDTFRDVAQDTVRGFGGVEFPVGNTIRILGSGAAVHH